MMSPEQTFALFELLCGRKHPGAMPPTAESVATINRKLGISLPASFIAFARACPHYGAVYASIGDDYSNNNHIINLNEHFHHDGAQETAGLPAWAILINHGHDGDCDCLDTRNFDAATGEYPVIYCEVPVWESEPSETEVHESLANKTFAAHLESFVLDWAQSHLDNRNRSGKLRTGSRDIVPAIEAILNGNLA